jgi:hypothetical protein
VTERAAAGMPIFVVLTYRIDAEQREDIHALIKSNSRGWWHHFPDVWLVRGHNTSFWRGLIADIIMRRQGSAVLVFRLDNQSPTPAWSGEGKKEMYDWLKTNYRRPG